MNQILDLMAEHPYLSALVVVCLMLAMLTALVAHAPLITEQIEMPRDGVLHLVDGTALQQNGHSTTTSLSAPVTRSCGTKVIRIMRCKDPSMWYAKLIGDDFPLQGVWAEGYVTREPSGLINYVHREDCVILSDMGATK